MPLIAALPKCEKELLPLLAKREQLTDDERVAIQKNGGESRWSGNGQKTTRLKYTMKAIHQIEKLPEANAKAMLLEITRQLLERKS